MIKRNLTGQPGANVQLDRVRAGLRRHVFDRYWDDGRYSWKGIALEVASFSNYEIPKLIQYDKRLQKKVEGYDRRELKNLTERVRKFAEGVPDATKPSGVRYPLISEPILKGIIDYALDKKLVTRKDLQETDPTWPAALRLLEYFGAPANAVNGGWTSEIDATYFHRWRRSDRIVSKELQILKEPEMGLYRLIDREIHHSGEIDEDEIDSLSGDQKSEHTIFQQTNEGWGVTTQNRQILFLSKSTADEAERISLVLNEEIEPTEGQWLSHISVLERESRIKVSSDDLATELGYNILLEQLGAGIVTLALRRSDEV